MGPAIFLIKGRHINSLIISPPADFSSGRHSNVTPDACFHLLASLLLQFREQFVFVLCGPLTFRLHLRSVNCSVTEAFDGFDLLKVST